MSLIVRPSRHNASHVKVKKFETKQILTALLRPLSIVVQAGQIPSWRSEEHRISSFVCSFFSEKHLKSIAVALPAFPPDLFVTRLSSLIMAESSATPSASSESTQQDGADFRPSTTFWNRTVNFTRMLTGQMSPAGQKRYWADADERYSQFDCKRCERDRDYLLKYSPTIRFMNENIRKLGGEMGPQNIHCRTCRGDEEAMQGGFDHKYGIKICANWVQERSQLEDVMAHEMVHAYDHLRFKTNLTEEDDLRHAACSEVSWTQLSRDTSY
jgi:inner membrane protease ATP23